jgi:hypothetical protein
MGLQGVGKQQRKPLGRGGAHPDERFERDSDLPGVRLTFMPPSQKKHHLFPARLDLNKPGVCRAHLFFHLVRISL